MNHSITPSSNRIPFMRRAQALAVASAITILAAGSVHAQTAPQNDSAMVRLIRGLIQSGALAKDVGEALLAQAQTEALAAQQVQRQAAAAPAPGLRAEPGDVRVTYVPQTVRDQIRDEIKTQVMAQAKNEGWAAPNETPEWSKRIRFEGDIRLRNESRFFSGDNSNEIYDFARLNANGPYDVNLATRLEFPPLLNTREDRKNLWRARARIGLLADISDFTHAGIRLASGSDDSPVSTTQTLGGGLGKKNVWLDQAWVSHKPTEWLTVTGGRFASPFVATDTLFSSDLNFDGVAAQFQKVLPSNKDVSLFGTIGVIPLEYSSDNAPTTSLTKMRSENKWLFGVQAGASWKFSDDNRFRGAVAYYDFKNITGQVSEPCALYNGADHCSTDWSRPAFMQKGNTLMLLRNIALDPASPGLTPQPQYVGLASKFQLLDLNARWDTKVAGGYALRLDGNFIRNLAYDRGEMLARATQGLANNFEASGGTAYTFQATFGKPAPTVRGDWNVLAGYKYIESDAMPDGYNDSTFHTGGTNAKGFFFGGSYAVDKNTWFTGRWTATKQIHGAPFAVDTLQLEFNARF